MVDRMPSIPMSSNVPLVIKILSGSRCSLSAIVWSLVGCILMIHFYSLARHQDKGETQVRLNHFPLTRELEEIEEENFQLQPRGKRSPRAAKRRGGRKPSLIDEFLDDSSQIRLLFFPDHRTAFGPTRSAGNDSMYFYPGKQWLDTEGNPIQAHGGGILYDERTETYYWYGENKDGPTYHAHKKGAARVGIYFYQIQMPFPFPEFFIYCDISLIAFAETACASPQACPGTVDQVCLTG